MPFNRFSMLHLLIASSLAAGPAAARTILVTTNLDTDLAPPGTCTLRDAITAANTDATAGGCKAGDGADRIKLGKNQTYALSVAGDFEDDNLTGDLDIWGVVEIDGGGSTIDGNRLDRVLHLQPPRDPAAPTSVALRSLNITGGSTPVAGFAAGGGLRVIGDPGDDLKVSVRHCHIYGNSAPIGGGGVFVQNASLDMRSSQVTGNLALSGSGGGINCQGATGGCVVADSDVSDNTAASLGGGIAGTTWAGSDFHIDILRTSITGNSGALGGGVAGLGQTDSATPTLRISSSTLSGNRAGAVPGVPQTGIAGGLLVLDTNALVSNSTLSGNSAAGEFAKAQGFGGGVTTAGLNARGHLELINTTVANNEAPVGAGVVTFVAGVPGALTETVFLNTIVAGNTATFLPGSDSCFTTSGALQTSSGHNIEDHHSCGFTGPGDQADTDPLLGALADNSGPTWTHALLDGSPAIDSGDDVACQEAPVDGRDQRARKRPQGIGCDIGSVEMKRR